jgi:hypothetical protein
MLEGYGLGLTLMVLELNHMLDTGKYDNITIDDVYKHINDGTILQFLKERAGNDLDMSARSGDFAQQYVNDLQAIYDANGGDHRRKWGIERKGICLLLAWTNEVLQEGSGWRSAKLARR